MPRKVVGDLIPNFSGGLNSVSNSASLGENQVSLAQNARLTQFGAITKRGGTRRLYVEGPGNPTVAGLVEWALSDGTRYVIRTGSGGIWWGTMSTPPVTFTQITGSIASVDVDFAAFRNATTGDVLYIADGGLLNKLTVAAGPTFTLTENIASTASCTAIEVFNQRLWGCGDTGSPQSIFYSAINDGDTLGIGASGGGQIIVRTFGQQNVTALQALGTSLLIFHRSGISRLTGFGQDDIEAVPAGVTGDTGTTAKNSIVRVENTVYYTNVRGLFMATAEQVMPVDTPDKPDPLSIVLPTLTETQLSRVSAVFNRATREILILVPTVGAYVYHTILRSWAGPWDGAYLSSNYQPVASVGSATNVPVLIKGATYASATPNIEQLDYPGALVDSQASDGTGGTAIQWTVACRRFFFGDFASMKSFRWGYVLADLGGATSAQLSWNADSSGGSTPLTQDASDLLTTEADDVLATESGVEFGLASSVQSLRVPVWGTGYYADMLIEDASTDGAPTVSRVEVTGFDLGRR